VTVLYTNAQSIGGKIDELKVIAQELEPDIILLTETWCNSSIESAALALENYKLETELRKDRCDTVNGVGGGLLVYAKNNLQILPSDLTDNNFNQFCSFSISTKSEKLDVFLIYRPPSSGQNNLTELCEIVRQADKNTVMIGDFNLPGTDWANESSDAKGRELLETVQEEGFEQLVSFPTHTKGNILDLLLSNCPDADVETMKSDISDVDWRTQLDGRTVEEGWRFFRQKLSETVEKNVPKSGGRTKLKNPWMTREILRLIRRKRRKWKEVKNSASAEDMKQYKQLEKETSKKIRNAKRKMEKDLAYSEDKNNRKFARYIKSKTKSKTTIGPLITKEKKMLTEDKDMAEELNTFFASVFTKEDLQAIPEAEEEHVEVAMRPVVVTQQMIRKQIKKLRKEAAPGPDEITPGLLKMLEEEVLLPLEVLFNKSLTTAQVPSEWRTANVTPIFKKGTKGDPGNYRPVSLTSVPWWSLWTL